MIYFITSKPEHFTNKKIIDAFQNKNVDFQHLSPDQPDEFFIQKFKNNKKILVLLKPDHWRIFRICDILSQLGIESINSAEITKTFQSRWDVENALKIVMEKEAPKELADSILLPKSWYVLAGKQLSDKEKREFYAEIEEKFLQQIKTKGMIVKFPVNHTGFHFIHKITDFSQVRKLNKILDRSGLIFQEIIESDSKVLKCYCFGNAVFCHEKDEEVTEINLEDITEESTLEEIIDQNMIDYGEGKKMDRKLVPTPPIVSEFMKFIFMRFGIKLFGIDFIRTAENKYYVVDFNDFPGCRSLDEAGEIIANYTLKTYERLFS